VTALAANTAGTAGEGLLGQLYAQVFDGPGSTKVLTSLSAKTVHGYFSQRLAESMGSRIDAAPGAPGSVMLTAQLAA